MVQGMWLRLTVALVVAAVATGAPRVRRSVDTDGGEAASSYFYFSRTPEHAPDTKPFFPAAVLKSVREFGLGKAGADGEDDDDDDDVDEGDDHGLYRVLEQHADEGAADEGASSYEGGHRARKGSRVEHGYDRKHALEQAARGSHGADGHSHRYAQDGARSAAHHDEGSHYRQQQRGAKRTGGGKHHERKQHAKGSKTTGYHNVYHKDEYKKEHVFYDTSDHEGQFKRYGSAHEHHAAEAGRHGAGGHETGGHRDASYRATGGRDAGRYDERHAQQLHRHGKEQQQQQQQQEHEQADSHHQHQHGGHEGGAGGSGYSIIHH